MPASDGSRSSHSPSASKHVTRVGSPATSTESRDVRICTGFSPLTLNGAGAHSRGATCDGSDRAPVTSSTRTIRSLQIVAVTAVPSPSNRSVEPSRMTVTLWPWPGDSNAGSRRRQELRREPGARRLLERVRELDERGLAPRAAHERDPDRQALHLTRRHADERIAAERRTL